MCCSTVRSLLHSFGPDLSGVRAVGMSGSISVEGRGDSSPKRSWRQIKDLIGERRRRRRKASGRTNALPAIPSHLSHPGSKPDLLEIWPFCLQASLAPSIWGYLGRPKLRGLSQLISTMWQGLDGQAGDALRHPVHWPPPPPKF